MKDAAPRPGQVGSEVHAARGHAGATPYFIFEIGKRQYEHGGRALVG
jgi:hypothetical protein